MTELTAFLTSLYDSFSEAELQALQHSQNRLAELVESGTVPDDIAVPVYHASEVHVTLDVGLVAKETDHGMEVFVTEKDDVDASELSFTVDLFDLLEKEDLTEIIDDHNTKTPTYPSHGEQGASVGEHDRSTITNETIDVIEGIDPEYRETLKALGIERLTDLIDRSPYALADAVESEGVDVTPEKAADWLDEARGLIAVLSTRSGSLPVELVDGIGPVFGKRLRDAGIAELPALVERSPDDIAELVSSEEVTVSSERTGKWIDEATTKLEALEQIDEVRDERTAADAAEKTDTPEDER